VTIFCVGRNYAAHAAEMGTSVDPGGEPVVFLKPDRALLAPPGPIRFPSGAEVIHHEVELVIRVGAGAEAAALAVGLDLTDRKRQERAKRQGLPWATAKGFAGSAPIGAFVPILVAPRLDRLRFGLDVDGMPRQRGDSAAMIRPVERLLAELDLWFGLHPGDLVFTGTPEGVGPIHPGEVLDLFLEGIPAASARFTVAG
jgi:2-keto-4-pentenoate hydratase/2-oxohepta-3-ene-1,7-dioic acid hydratase in catechol pathway